LVPCTHTISFSSGKRSNSAPKPKDARGLCHDGYSLTRECADLWRSFFVVSARFKQPAPYLLRANSLQPMSVATAEAKSEVCVAEGKSMLELFLSHWAS